MPWKQTERTELRAEVIRLRKEFNLSIDRIFERTKVPRSTIANWLGQAGLVTGQAPHHHVTVPAALPASREEWLDKYFESKPGTDDAALFLRGAMNATAMAPLPRGKSKVSLSEDDQ